MAKIPDFDTIAEAVAFWETHDSADYWEELEEETFDVDLHQNLLHPKLVVLAYRPERCPHDGKDLNDIVIDHVTQNNGRLVVIRDVPALRCSDNQHEYILEETLDQIERLLELEQTQKLQPVETITVPVFSLKIPA